MGEIKWKSEVGNVTTYLHNSGQLCSGGAGLIYIVWKRGLNISGRTSLAVSASRSCRMRTLFFRYKSRACLGISEAGKYSPIRHD